MNKRQDRIERFAREYVIDLNGRRAAIAAGYSDASATVQASKLLTKANVQKIIDRLQSERATKLELKGEKVIEELCRLAFANMADYIKVQDGDAYIDFSQLSRDQAAAIGEITVEEYTEGRGEEKRDIKRTKFKLADKRGALELLGKHLKLFTDQVEHSGIIRHDTLDTGKLTTEELAEVERLLQSAESGSNQG